MKEILVKSVSQKVGTVLLVEFMDGTKKEYDLKILYKENPEIANLEKWGMIHWVKPEAGGAAVSWTPDHDISAEELFHNGSVQK